MLAQRQLVMPGTTLPRRGPVLGHKRTIKRFPAGHWRALCKCGWQGPATPFFEHAKKNIGLHLEEMRDKQKASATRRCSRCKEMVLKSLFSGLNRKHHVCKKCATEKSSQWSKAHPERSAALKKRAVMLRKYGITPGDAEKMLADQGGVCAICLQPPSDPRGYKMHVDHDHATGAVRGILCYSCNSGLGQFKDNVIRMEAAIEYLKRTATPAYVLPRIDPQAVTGTIG